MAHISGEQMGDIFMNWINGYERGEEEFVDRVTTDHRTLQQNAFRLFVRCMREWARLYDERYYDLRNEATCKLSKSIVEVLGNDDVIPYV